MEIYNLYGKNITNLNKLIEDSNNGRLMGETGNKIGSDVLLNNVSHIIQNLKVSNNKLVGDIKILDTPSGKKLKELLKYDLVNLSSRSIGEVDSNGKIISQEITTFDYVENFDSKRLLRAKRFRKIQKIKNRLQ